MADAILAGAQIEVGRRDGGWLVAHYAVVLGLQRVNDAGNMESTTALFTPVGQPPYTTEGLLSAGDRIRARAEVE